MPETVYCGTFAGHLIRFRFNCLTTHYYFRDFLTETQETDDDIRVSSDLFAYAKNNLPPGSRPGYIEYRACIGLTARYLLQWNCSIFHAVSFIWKDRAWLLTGPSGTGKTTQFRNWQRLYPDEIQMISGDMPVIEKKRDSVFVHPSSWNGKENYHGNCSAPLGGIIILEQGKENSLKEKNLSADLIVVLEQMLVRPKNEDEIRQLSCLVETMFSVPVLRFINRGDDDSTKLLRKIIESIA